MTKAAVVIDVREGETLQDFPEIFQQLKNQPGVMTELWFLEASDAALIRRFSETRRPHPLDPMPLYEKASRAYAADRFADAAEYARHALSQGAAGPLRAELQCLRGESLLRSHELAEQLARELVSPGEVP